MNRVQRVLALSILVAAVAIVLAVVRLATLGDAGSTTQTAAPSDDAAATAPAQPVRAVKIALVQGLPKGGPANIRIRAGDELRLTVTSTGAEDTVVIDGYAKSANVSPASPARLNFVADQPGVFDILLDMSGTKLADLEVVG